MRVKKWILYPKGYQHEALHFFVFFPYGFQPFSALCINLKFQKKSLHFIFAAVRSRLSYSDPRLQISSGLRVTFKFHSAFGGDSEKHFFAYVLNFILAHSCKFCIFCDSLDSMQFLQIRDIQKQILSGSAT